MVNHIDTSNMTFKQVKSLCYDNIRRFNDLGFYSAAKRWKKILKNHINKSRRYAL